MRKRLLVGAPTGQDKIQPDLKSDLELVFFRLALREIDCDLEWIAFVPLLEYSPLLFFFDLSSLMGLRMENLVHHPKCPTC